MKNEDLRILLHKYLNGDCSREESARVDDWYQKQEHNLDDTRLLNPRDRMVLEQRLFQEIKAKITVQGEVPADLHNIRSQKASYVNFYRAAAAIVFVSLVGIAALLFREKPTAVQESEQVALVNDLIRVTNRTPKVAERILSDGTKIKLQPNGIIEYPEVFSGQTREVHLTGEAFFDVAKDKQRPFIISTGDIAVKVLGTSFNVKAYQGSKEISVAVKTGRVSVYTKGGEKKYAKANEEVILTPNQEVVYNKVKENFSKKIVDEPRILLEKSTLFHTQYDATPVNQIFEELEENYGIDIVYDDNIMKGCHLTTTKDEEGLYERVIIICQAIGAQYELQDGMIWINSNGCQ